MGRWSKWSMMIWGATAILCIGCPAAIEKPILAPVVEKTQSPQAEKLFNEGVAHFESAQWEQADSCFLLFVEQFPDDALIRQVEIYQGRIAMANEQFEKARVFLEKVHQQGGDDSTFDYATMHLGIVEFKMGNYQRSVELLTPYAGRFAMEKDNLRVLKTLWMSTGQQGEWQQQIVWMDKFLEAGPPETEKEEVMGMVSDIIASKEESQLVLVAKQLPQKDRIWTQLMGQIARIQFDSEKYDAATDTVEEIKESGQENAVAISELAELIEQRNSADIRTIGVLLPLSGKMRLIGQDVLKGVMLASKRNRFGKENTPLSIVMRDTSVAGKNIDKIVEELVLKERVGAIVGPIGVTSSRIAAQKAQRMGVPMILLTSDVTTSKSGNYIFRKFASNEKELEALLAKSDSLVENGTKPLRYAICYPNNGYGKLMKKLLVRQLDESEGALVAEVSFEPKTTDFGKSAKQLAQSEFSVLLLPMTASQLALAAPALAANGIWSSTLNMPEKARAVTYLVPSIGYSNSVVTRAGRYLQGAMFVSSFQLERTASEQYFSRTFNNEYKSNPSSFAAYGYDAVLLISNAVKTGVSSRHQLRIWLDETVAAGEMVFPFSGFDEQGDIISLPPVFTLTGNALQ